MSRRQEAEAGRPRPFDASSPLRQPVLAVTSGALVLLASLANYLNHNDYPLLATEVGLAAAALIGAAALAGVVYAASGRLGRTLLEVLLCYLAFDLNFDGIGVVLGTLIVVTTLRCMTVPILGIIGFVVLVTEISGDFGDAPLEAAAGAAPATTSAIANSDAPVLLHLILDEHLGIEGLAANLPEVSFLREELKAFYAEHRFRLFGGAYSEHLHTVNAIPYILDFGAAQSWRPEHRQGLVLKQNAYFKRLKELGYELNVYQTAFVDFCEHDAVRFCTEHRASGLGPLAASALPAKDKAGLVLYGFLSLSEATTAAVGLYDLGVWRARSHGVELPFLLLDDRRRTNSVGALAAFDRLIGDLQNAQPGEAYFAHLLLPHFPYATERDCALKRTASWQMRHSPTAGRQERQRAYVDQVHCTTSKIARALEALEASPAGRHSIVVVHGDHGSRITRVDPGVGTIGRFDDADLIASHSTLFAVRAPGIEADYDATAVPVARLLEALSGSSFRSAAVELGAGFVPSVVLENRDWKPVRRHDLPGSWTGSVSDRPEPTASRR